MASLKAHDECESISNSHSVDRHQLFLEGLQKYGNDWKKIANMVCPPLYAYAQISTRNLVQVRTHAQKYFQKINKNVGS